MCRAFYRHSHIIYLYDTTYLSICSLTPTAWKLTVRLFSVIFLIVTATIYCFLWMCIIVVLQHSLSPSSFLAAGPEGGEKVTSFGAPNSTIAIHWNQSREMYIQKTKKKKKENDYTIVYKIIKFRESGTKILRETHKKKRERKRNWFWQF